VTASRAPFLYLGPIATAIRGLKFSGWKTLARHLAGAMGEVWDLEAETVTWVPLSRRRRARRGFDQAELLARAVAPRLGLPVRRLLLRTRDTPPQARTGAATRRRALRGAFRPTGRAASSVLLVDDVLTTGATAAGCATALRQAGAERVIVLVAARSVRGAIPARCLGAREGPLPV
jgi:competence protein ComFC